MPPFGYLAYDDRLVARRDVLACYERGQIVMLGRRVPPNLALAEQSGSVGASVLLRSPQRCGSLGRVGVGFLRTNGKSLGDFDSDLPRRGQTGLYRAEAG